MNKKSKIIILAVGAVVIVAAIVCGVLFAPKTAQGDGVNKYGYTVETADQIDFVYNNGENPENENTHFEVDDVDAALIAQNLQKLMNLVDSAKDSGEDPVPDGYYVARTVILKYGDKQFNLRILSENNFFFVYKNEDSNLGSVYYNFHNTNLEDINAVIEYFDTFFD